MDERNVLIILNLSGNIDPVEKYISKRRKIYEKESSVSASLCCYDSKGNNSPQNIGLTIVGYLYRQGIEKRAMGYACAVGLVLLIIVMVVNMIQLAATGTFKKEER